MGVCGGVGELVMLTTRTSSSLSIRSIVILAAAPFVEDGILLRGFDVAADRERALDLTCGYSPAEESEVIPTL
jgi:hypothetical protein